MRQCEDRLALLRRQTAWLLPREAIESLFKLPLGLQRRFPSPLQFSGYKSIVRLDGLIASTSHLRFMSSELDGVPMMGLDPLLLCFNAIGCLQAQLK